MLVREHSDYPRIASAVKDIAGSAREWTGVIYRSAPPKWSTSTNLLTGAGSFKAGGRFNAAGSFPMVYGSTTPELAMIESLAFQRRAGLPVEHAMPLVFKAISVKVERLLDLTNRDLLAAVGLTQGDLAEAWWQARSRGEEAITQAVGRATHASRLQALQVPSAHCSDRGTNILLLPDHIEPPSELKVLRHSRKC